MAEATATVTRVIEVDVRASAQAQAHIAQIASSMGTIEKNTTAATGSVDRFSKMVENAGKAFLGAFVVNKLVEWGLALNSLNDSQKMLIARMTQVTGTTEGANLAFSEVVRISREQGREMEGTAKLYEKVARQQEQLGITTRGVSLVTEGFAASLRLSGTNSQEANAAMLQFSQALASGKLAGDEFRSMTENNSVFMYELGKATNKTQGELKTMAKEGKLDLEFLRKAMLDYGKDGTNMMERVLDKVRALPQTFEMAISGVKASLADYLNALGQTSTQSEGILTRMARAVGDNFQLKALQTRKWAIVAEEEAKAKGTWTKEMADANRYKSPAEENLDSVIAMRNDALDKMKKLNDSEKIEIKNFGENSARLPMIRQKVAMEWAKVAASNRILAEENAKTSLKEQELFTGPPAKTPEKPPKADRSIDPLVKMSETLDTAQLMVEGRLKYIGDWQLRVNDAWEQTLLNKNSIFAKNLKKALDEQAEIIDASTLEKKMQDLIQRSVQASDERKIAQDKKDADALQTHDWDRYNRARSAALGLARQQSPREELEANIAKADALRKVANSTDDIRIATEAADEAFARFGERMKKDSVAVGDLMQQHIGTAFDNLITDMISFKKTGSQIMSDFVTNILTELARIEVKKTMSPVIGMVGDFFKSMFGSWTSSPNALGGAFENGFKFMAQGGVLAGPTYLGSTNDGTHQIGGEAGPEAVMPLRRGNDGKLGVGATPVTVNVINNAPNTRASASEQTNAKGERHITVMVEEVVEQALGGGKFDKVLGNSFGVSRKGK